MKSKKETKAWKILEFIGSKSSKGATLTEIQYFIWTVLEEKDGKEFWEPCKPRLGMVYVPKTRKTRGHWCTALYGGDYYHTGLLHEYCEKRNGAWVLIKFPKENENIYKYR